MHIYTNVFKYIYVYYTDLGGPPGLPRKMTIIGEKMLDVSQANSLLLGKIFMCICIYMYIHRHV
jgi:hypothetical protein